jgi:hypothetical protein
MRDEWLERWNSVPVDLNREADQTHADVARHRSVAVLQRAERGRVHGQLIADAERRPERLVPTDPEAQPGRVVAEISRGIPRPAEAPGQIGCAAEVGTQVSDDS